jgi:hypothetical protein
MVGRVVVDPQGVEARVDNGRGEQKDKKDDPWQPSFAQRSIEAQEATAHRKTTASSGTKYGHKENPQPSDPGPLSYRPLPCRAKSLGGTTLAGYCTHPEATGPPSWHSEARSASEN